MIIVFFAMLFRLHRIENARKNNLFTTIILVLTAVSYIQKRDSSLWKADIYPNPPVYYLDLCLMLASVSIIVRLLSCLLAIGMRIFFQLGVSNIRKDDAELKKV